MSAFYKMDPSAWDVGTTSLTLEQEAAYLRIVNAIHKHDQPVPNNDRVLAGMFRCSTRKARSLVDALIRAGKVRIEGGSITNDRAASDLVHRQLVSSSRAESGAKGGRTRAQKSANPLENKEPEQAIASPRIEENREEKTETNVSVQKKPPSARRAKARTLLPDEWELPADWAAWAKAEGLSELCVRREASQFANHHRSRGNTMADWRAAWRTWVGNVDKFRGSARAVEPAPGEVRVRPNGERVRFVGGQVGWERVYA